MIKKLLSLSALALTLSLGQAPLAFADHDMHHDVSKKIHKLSEKLDLTAEQKTKIKAILEKYTAMAMTKRDDMKAVRVQINQAFHKNDINETQIDGFVTQEQQIVGALLKLRLEERMEISKVLTDKQKEKLNMMMDEKEKHHHGYHAE